MNYRSKYLKYKNKYLSLLAGANIREAPELFWSDNTMTNQLRGNMNRFLDVRDSSNLSSVTRKDNTLYKTHQGSIKTCFSAPGGPYVSGKDGRCPDYRYKNVGETSQGKNTLCCNNKVVYYCNSGRNKKTINTQKLYNCAKFLIGVVDGEVDRNITVLDFYNQWSTIPLEKNQHPDMILLNHVLENDGTLYDLFNIGRPRSRLYLWSLIEVIFNIGSPNIINHDRVKSLTYLGDTNRNLTPTLRDISIDSGDQVNYRDDCIWPKFIWATLQTFMFYKINYQELTIQINRLVSSWNGENRNKWNRVSNNFDSLFKKFYYDTTYEVLEKIGY